MQVNPSNEGRSITAEARRAQIIAACIEVLAEIGYRHTTFAKIADRAGLSSTRLISYHFGGKNELMKAVVRHVYGLIGQDLGARTADQPNARAALHAHILGTVGFIAEHPVQMQALLSIFLNLTDDNGEPIHDRDGQRAARAPLEQMLRTGQENGEFRAFDPLVMAVTIQRAIDGLPFLLHSEPELDLEAYGRELIALFDRATRTTEGSP